MLFTQPEQFVVLAALLVGGWLLGYVSAPSPTKWKRRLREQADRFAAYHEEVEDRLRAARTRATSLNEDLGAVRADYADAERMIAGLRGRGLPMPPPADLTRLSGIDERMQARLADFGVVRFEDIEKLSAEDEVTLELRLGLPEGFIARMEWRSQAALLRAGQDAEHAERFADAEPASL